MCVRAKRPKSAEDVVGLSETINFTRPAVILHPITSAFYSLIDPITPP